MSSRLLAHRRSALHVSRWLNRLALVLLVAGTLACRAKSDQATRADEPIGPSPNPAGAIGRGIGRPDRSPLPRPKNPDPMIKLPGGVFQMGDPNGFPDEVPVHAVTVAPFLLDVHEVTVGAYAACVQAGGCTAPSAMSVYDEQPGWKANLLSSFCNVLRADRMDHPVNCIDFFQAEDYCEWEGKRLPTEEEWEYAARNGSRNSKYPWGDEFPDETRMNAAGPECNEFLMREFKFPWGKLYPASDGFPGTAPVGRFPAGNNQWGVQDLMGNVFEYTSTEYCPYQQPDCHSKLMTVRGGGWLVELPKKARSGRRNDDIMWHRSPDVGVRCANSLP